MAHSVRPDLLAFFLILIGALATPHAAWPGEKVRFVDLMSAESSPTTSAGDHELFAGFIPGEPVMEDELEARRHRQEAAEFGGILPRGAMGTTTIAESLERSARFFDRLSFRFREGRLERIDPLTHLREIVLGRPD